MPESITLICPASVTLPLTTMFVGPLGALSANSKMELLVISKLLVPVISAFAPRAKVPAETEVGPL